MPYVIIFLFCGLSAGIVAKLKGSSFFIWFLIGAVLPVIGTIAALASRIEGRELRRRCERCSAVVPLSTQVCTTCGLDLDFPDVAIAPRPGPFVRGHAPASGGNGAGARGAGGPS